MDTKYMFIVAAMTVMLIGATAVTADNAFADEKKKYGKSQVVKQVNKCGNGDMAMYVGCENTASQIQGDSNRVAGATAQSFDN
jgi:hypothetical protein